MVTLMEGKWSFYKGGQFREEEWSCYGGGQFNGGRMVLLQRQPVQWREIGHVRGVASLMEGEHSCYGGGQWRENGYVMEVVSLMEGARSC